MNFCNSVQSFWFWNWRRKTALGKGSHWGSVTGEAAGNIVQGAGLAFGSPRLGS